MKYVKICILLFILIFFNKILALAQPTITPKAGNIIFTLDASGNKIISLPDVATVTTSASSSPTITIGPTSFNCSTLGLQMVTVTASDEVATPSNVSFNYPLGITRDGSGNLFVAEYNSIRKITPTGLVTTFAGNLQAGSSDGTGNTAYFNNPMGLAADALGNVYVADVGNNKIRKIDPSGIVTTVAGSGTKTFADGIGTAAGFNNPQSITLDAIGNIYVADYGNSRIRKITQAGIVTTIAGSNYGFADGPGTTAKFISPSGIVSDKAGNIYVADQGNKRIRKIDQNGIVTTLAGNGNAGIMDGAGNIATFYNPSGLAIDAEGNIYVSDQLSMKIRQVTPTGFVSTVAGNTTIGSVDGIGIKASFSYPFGLVTDADNNIYVADAGNNKIREISSTAVVTTFAGSGAKGSQNGNIKNTSTTQQSTLQIPVTVVSPLIISSTYSDVIIPQYGSCNAILPDYTTTATATSSCSGKIAFSQLPVAGTQLITGSSVPVTITATDAYGTTAAKTFQVSVNPVPTDTVKVSIAASSTNTCAGVPIFFTASVINGGSTSSYQWQVNGNNTGTNSATYTNGMLYDNDQITCIVTSSLSCLSIPMVTSNRITVHINPNVTPSVIISSSASTVCAGNAVTFIAKIINGGSNPSYQWQMNGNKQSVNTSTFTTTTLADGDIVNCVINSNALCLTNQTAVSNQDTIKVSPILIPSVTITASATTVFSGTKVTCTAATFNAGTAPDYQWQVNGGNVGANSQTYTSNTFKNGDVIRCKVTGNNSAACVINNGIISNALTINVNTLLNAIKIPTAFSPNGDGINDLWNIPALTNYADCLVEVYSRYGQLIYQSKGYSKAWDGTLNGKILPVGTYYYIIGSKTDLQRIAGNVTILR
ncbi:MAG: gliding motility-associated C-terminal domain-containing protein [Janthinobacterium lividum]